MKCVYCHPMEQGKGRLVRMEHKKCSHSLIEGNVIKEYEVAG